MPQPPVAVPPPADAPGADARPFRVVVLVSGSGSTMQALLDATAETAAATLPGTLPAGQRPVRVVAVGSDKPAAQGLSRASVAGVTTFAVPPAEHPDRTAWERALVEAVAQFEPDLVVLAGFMRILGAPMLGAFGGRILNTHPALLPSFPGAHGVRDALAHGVRVTGCTVHLVDEGVDTGPIVAQAAVPVLDDDDEATLHERIKEQERLLLVEVVGRLARGWSVTGRKVRFS
ncbi:phosphoribosylglycinamide formyltransferase [Kineococcus xinjiangensis]|uniref:phosphoribosylglycinamide formyltransferase n=1 Tax=Kineococcus xinjiangensis TaxID=512762 RepID=UPI001FEBC822|nr:phosphoribosylglycinamide formyltransferase [Kineococcus xinjiangensis]